MDSGLVNSQIYALLAHKDKLYAGGANGLSVSKDHGHTWEQINYAVSDISAIAASNDTMYASSFGFSGLHASYDGGITWKNIYSGTQVSALTLKDGNIYIGTIRYGLFLSTDKGVTFTRVDGNLMNHQITKIYIDGQSFLIATSKGFYRSIDKGATWIQKNLVLWEHSYITNFLRQGNRLYLSSLDGVYISNDNGDNWKSINEGLIGFFNFSLAKIGSTIFVNSLEYGVFKRDTTDLITTVPVYVKYKMDFTILPNPSSGNIQLLMPDGVKQIMITNTLGQIVMELETQNTQKQIELDKKGMYIITIKKGETVSAKKVIVQE
jgi:photosystem II stability/assembly factor-like uncharacterized protein